MSDKALDNGVGAGAQSAERDPRVPWLEEDGLIYDADGYAVVNLATRKKSAHAEYIVRACNAFPDLLEALRLADEALENAYGEWIGPNVPTSRVQEDMVKVKAAIAKATAK